MSSELHNNQPQKVLMCKTPVCILYQPVHFKFDTQMNENPNPHILNIVIYCNSTTKYSVPLKMHSHGKVYPLHALKLRHSETHGADTCAMLGMCLKFCMQSYDMYQ